jgi:hypothetical protein
MKIDGSGQIELVSSRFSLALGSYRIFAHYGGGNATETSTIS